MRAWTWLGCFAVVGCSAIIDPDEGALGGPADAGMIDGGIDAAVDANVDGGDDAGTDAGRDAAVTCSSNAECDDLNPCNGEETCGPEGRCVVGLPLDCSDGVDCTRDACDPALGCTNTEIEGFCTDGVCHAGGFCDPDTGCVGGDPIDCNDSNPCTVDMCDPGMGGCFNPPRDSDGDGWPAARVGGTNCADGADCDDTDPTVNPDADEVCDDGDDNDCDGGIDEGCDDVPDDCGSAIAIPLSGGSGSVSGVIGDAGHDYETRCTSGRTGRDVVYYVDVPRGGIGGGTHDITIDTIGSDFDTVLAVSPDCGDWDYGGLGCNDDLNPGTELDSRVWVHRFDVPFGSESRRLYILVDAYRNDAGGSYEIHVNVDGAAGDSCFGGRMSLAGGGSVIGFNGSAIGFGFENGSCSADGDTAGEVPFDFPGGRAEFTATSATFVPTIYARRSCNDEDSESGCDVGGPIGGGLNEAQIDVDGGSVIWVDGMGAGDSFTLQYDP